MKGKLIIIRLTQKMLIL